jgi:hypothetical protein
VNIQENVSGVGTSSGPGFCIHNGKPFLAWKGSGSDPGIYYSTATTLTPGSNGQYDWAEQTHYVGIATSHGPAVASLNGTLCLAWKGESESAIYVSLFDGKTWTPQQKLPVGTSDSPALAALSSKFLLAWKGEGTDVGIYYSTSADGKTWSAQQEIEDIGGTSNTPAICGASDGNAYMAWKAEPGDNRLFWSKYDGSKWSAQQLITSGTSTGPAIVDDSNHIKWLSWKSVGGGAIYLCSLNDEAKNEWSPQRRRYGVGTSDRPALIPLGAGPQNVMMAWKGAGSDAGIYYGTLDLSVPDTLTYNYPRTNIGQGSSSSMAIEAQLTLKRDGSCNFTGTFWNEAVLKESWYITMGVRDGYGNAYAFSTSGDIGPGTQPWNLSANNLAIAQNWTGIAINSPSGSFSIHAGDSDDLLGSLEGVASDLGVAIKDVFEVLGKILGGGEGEEGSETPSAGGGGE